MSRWLDKAGWCRTQVHLKAVLGSPQCREIFPSFLLLDSGHCVSTNASFSR